MATMSGLPMIQENNLKVADWPVVMSQFVMGG